MSNRPREKGTRYEVALLDDLRLIFGEQVERAPLKGIRDIGDYVGVPVSIEAKNTAVMRLPEWVRRLRLMVGNRWAIFWSGGDRRRKDSPGELMIVPAAFGKYLLQLYAKDESSRCNESTK